jgi:hypothetical protein
MNTINDSNATGPDSNTYFRPSLLFGILTPIFVLSVLCYLYIFIQFSWKRQLCRNVHNHLVLVILIFSFLQVFLIE